MGMTFICYVNYLKKLIVGFRFFQKLFGKFLSLCLLLLNKFDFDAEFSMKMHAGRFLIF